MIIDGIVIAVLLVSAIIAFFRGFIREVLTILGVVGGLAAAYLGGPMLSPLMRGWLGVVDGEEPKRLLGLIPYPIVADLLSYGLIFIVVVIVLSIVSHVLAETVRSIGLGAIDRTLGFIFGLLRGALLLAILYLPVHIGFDDEAKAEYLGASRTVPYLESMSGVLAGYLPQSAKDQIKDTAAQEAENTGVKDRLQQIDLLRGEDPAKLEQQPAADPAADPASNPKAPGYNDEFRQKMNDMFKDAVPVQPQQGNP